MALTFSLLRLPGFVFKTGVEPFVMLSVTEHGPPPALPDAPAALSYLALVRIDLVTGLGATVFSR